MRFSWREDVVAPGEDGRAELRHERDRRLLPHPRQLRIGIGPERGDVDVEMRGVGHGAVPVRRMAHRVAKRSRTVKFSPPGAAGASREVRARRVRRPHIAGSCCAACERITRARARRGYGCRRNARRVCSTSSPLDRRRRSIRSAAARFHWGPATAPAFPARGTANAWVMNDLPINARPNPGAETSRNQLPPIMRDRGRSRLTNA